MSVMWIEVQRDERRAGGRVEDGVARLLVPRAAGLEEIAVTVDLLPDALARLVDLGPRPVPAAAEPLRVSATSPAEAPVGDDGQLAGSEVEREALRSSLGSDYVRWRVEVRTRSAAHSADVSDLKTLEVIDTDGGLLLIVSEPPEVELWPVTPTAVFGRLAALLSGPMELSEGTRG